MITKPRASLFLSEIIAQGGGIHCKLEGVVLFVEEQKEQSQRKGKFQKMLQEVRETWQEWNVAALEKEVAQRSTD